MAEVRDEAVAMRQDDAARGFWLDLRSKRDITAEHLTEETCGGYNYYDPLLSPKVGVVSVAPGVDWLDQTRPRSWALNLHSFRFADYWILHYLASGDASVLARLDEVVLDYLERIWPGKPDRTDSEFVYSDVSVAARASVMAFLIGREQAGAYRSADTGRILRALEQHVAWASDDANYNSNNHGLFNDLHLLVGVVNAPEVECLRRIARPIAQRFLTTYVDRQVNDEGVHLEHTPAYALLWVLLANKARRVMEGLAASVPDLAAMAGRMDATVEKVTRALWWFTKPDGELVNLGDQGRTVSPSWLAAQGGEAGACLFPKSGYAFYKDEDSYLALAAAYHATKLGREGYRAASHKQRDELQVLWSEKGQDILVDTGLRAYDFGPERRYAVSKQAHNTLSLSPGDYLTENILVYMDATAPYGGATRVGTACLAGSGWNVLAGEDPLLAREGILHWRLLLHEPRKWLLVCDLARLPKGGRAEWNFHIDGDWRCTGYSADDASFRCKRSNLVVSRLSNGERRSAKAFLHRAEFDPLRGWRFAGDPFPVNNLCFVEWLAGSTLHFRGTAFGLVKPRDSLAKVQASAASAGRIALDMELQEGDRRRSVRVEFEAPEPLASLLLEAIGRPAEVV